MAWPIQGVAVGTPYGRRGSHWGCNKDSAGRGVHTGDDFPAPVGTKVFAPIAGDIRWRNYGPAFGEHQFAISPDPDQPFGKGEVFFAHMRKRLPDGTRVSIGQYIGEVGAEGNVTGPHLHAEYHPTTKGSWNCNVHADPTPVWKYNPTGGSGVADSKYTANIYSSKLGFGEPTNGDASSDTVKELQHLLKIPITGKYDDHTDAAVRQWQLAVCKDKPDTAQKSYLGPAQRAVMFKTPPYTIHDDGLPKIASEAPPSPATANGTTLGRYLKAQGFVVHDDNVPEGRASTWRGVEYIVLHHTGSADAVRAIADATYIRRGGVGTYPPLAQLMLSHQNEVWVTCRERDGQPSPGRASHAGEGHGYGIPDDTMNERSLGLEVCNDGTEPIATDPDQYATMIRLVKALQLFYKVPVVKVIGHKEWSTTGKPDPRDSMAKIRADLAGVTIPPPVVEPPPVIIPPPVVEPPLPEIDWASLLTQEEADARYALKDHTHPAAPGSKTVLWDDYSGKPTKPQVMSGDGVWRMVDGIACDDPPVSGSEHHMLYARLNFKWISGTATMAKVECKYVREDGDATAFDERHYAIGTQSVPFQMMHFEAGVKGQGGRWWLKVHGGVASVEITTRYAKVHVIAVV